ncbi:hypothetical protein Pmar_PMAR026372 [Perkinsus marinus ATCC 50983]|uniref:Uncharacterized protein n=1 Tax=Perkinsus marinus (strain ATCC 50983 / TXsc) TaxID=423536 RepID=C5LEK2_PERM5|nr:hypothetical protein Pmar_PMAR026372 [Perkinsus marinus ATCC 50983]EER04820.1 hypothetical protein Pmar_PMAR026372 [Perkinsus marinus ATCC 50983]|eukprot:XP_002773004.1 hypothetical protein Pmar_PMAR026372 [Perkinsus marinus ATCC 50983]
MLDAGLILAQFIGRVSQKKEPMTIQQFPLEAPRGNPVGQMNCAFADNVKAPAHDKTHADHACVTRRVHHAV